MVLQQALKLLAGKIQPDNKVESQPAAEEYKSKVVIHSNTFDLLHLEETSVDLNQDSSALDNTMPTPRAPAKTSKEDRMQDAFDLAMYCLYADLEDLEDYLVLEITRYAIDQKNADTLPFIINTAIDQAHYMSDVLCKLVDDPCIARVKFTESDHDSNTQASLTSPLKRMSGLCFHESQETTMVAVYAVVDYPFLSMSTIWIFERAR